MGRASQADCRSGRHFNRDPRRSPTPRPQESRSKGWNFPEDQLVQFCESAQIAINQVPTEISSLGSKLQEIYSARRNKDMFISASPKLPYGDVVRVIDISKGAGVGDIGRLKERMR